MGVTTDKDHATQWVTLHSNAAAEPVVDVGLVLGDALVRDSAGLSPVDVGYVPTWNLEYAVALVFDLKATLATTLTGSVQSFTSEGTSVTRSAGATAADFRRLADAWRRKATGGGGITVISLEGSGGAPLPRSAYDGVTPNAVVQRWDGVRYVV